MNRYHPILKRNKPHLGTDYAAPHGTPIVTVADGVVEEASYRGGNGNFVKVRHDNVYTTQYLHMSKFGPGIRRGVRVQQGQVIGYVGSTGLATGPHLCYRFWKNGKQVDPFKETPQSTEPLAANEMPAFMTQKEALDPALQNIRYHEATLFASVKTLRDMAKY
jgi:murein DD-endopeptidase MepM/ murein hydrolase activator NlpD